MAKTILGADSVKVVVDGFPIENLWEFRLDVGTYDGTDFESGAFYRDRASNVQAHLRTANGTTLEFNVEGKEQVGNTVYFYGPLRALFPEVFRDIDPLEWQQAYLTAMARPSLDRFKLRRDDELFKTPDAEWFRLGFEAGHKAGAVNERKLAKIATDGLKNPPKDKDAYSGVLGQAFNKKSGK